MKKIVSFFLATMSVLFLTSCSSRNGENQGLSSSSFEKSASLDIECIGENACELKDFSADEAKNIEDLIKNAEWSNGTSDCLSDFSFSIGGKTYYYHSECGTVNDGAAEKSFILSEQDRLKINSMLKIEDVEFVEETDKATAAAFETVYDGDISLCTLDFGLRLLKETSTENQNTVISPISVLSALAMAANGAKGETLSQIQNLLGGEIDKLNAGVSNYLNGIASDESVKIANSVWINDRYNIAVNNNFKNEISNNFHASFFKEKFGNDALKKINHWISENSGGTINDALKEILNEAVAYLINTVFFESEWKVPYTEYQVTEDIGFTAGNGTVKRVSMLNSTEDIGTYFILDNAKAFSKEYKNGYRFLGILPNEDVGVYEVLNTLTAEDIFNSLAFKIIDYVDAEPILRVGIPKFEFEFDFRLSINLKRMGMTTAFDSKKADFGNMATCAQGNIYIDEVYHNTFIRLIENGTKAGASTIAELKCASLAESESEIIYLTFDRPFIFAICSPDSTPIFMGIVNEP